MRHIALTVSYDGTDWCGSQRQNNGATIQGELERALLQALQVPTPVTLAGRTDAGVHARGQVAASWTKPLNLTVARECERRCVKLKRLTMIQTIEALIDENGCVSLLEEVRLPFARRALVTILNQPATEKVETALLSEASLAADWNRPEEEEAWSHLQRA